MDDYLLLGLPTPSQRARVAAAGLTGSQAASVEMPDQGPPPSRPACLKPFLARWPQLRLHAIGLGRRSLFSPSSAPHAATAKSFSAAVQKRWGGRSGSLDTPSLDTRDGDGDGQAHARPRAQQAIVIIRLRTTDDICDLPPSFSFPLPHTHTHAHTHTTSAPIARFCLLACCRTLSSRSAAAAAVTFPCRACLTLSAPEQGAKSASPG